MPVTRLGEWCHKCGQRPANEPYMLCRRCELEVTAFGASLDRWRDQVIYPYILDSDSERFDEELAAWLA